MITETTGKVKNKDKNWAQKDTNLQYQWLEEFLNAWVILNGCSIFPSFSLPKAHGKWSFKFLPDPPYSLETMLPWIQCEITVNRILVLLKSPHGFLDDTGKCFPVFCDWIDSYGRGHGRKSGTTRSPNMLKELQHWLFKNLGK